MDPIQHKIVRQQAPAVILRRIGTAALGDAHGLDHWCDRAVYFSLRAARTVPLGDLIDRSCSLWR
ncbi:MAG: hypothetical protein NTZ10_01700 [Candidatus Saganbacteria bacterium]|nr:hypothetical protein [Candidatus Saganbacteria bacterium]